MADLPPDVTVIGSDSLMRLMQAYTAFVGYAATQEVIAKTNAMSAAGRYRSERGKLYIALREDSRYSEEQRKAELDCDDYLVSLKKEEIVTESYSLLVRALKTDAENKYAMLSRELTRRGGGQERHFD